jgi:hypothetical protein
VLQSASTNAVNLSGSDALSRALDAAAGETDTTPSGDESLLIDRVDAEYLRYFTGTGRPTGVWKSAIDRVRVAQTDVDRWLAAVEDVNDRVSRHEALTATVRTLEGSLVPASRRLAAARQADQELSELREQLRQARLVAAAAASASSHSTAAYGQRRQLIDDGKRRGETLVALQSALIQAEQREGAANEAAGAATAAADSCAAALPAAATRFDAAKAAVEAYVAREAAEKAAEKLAVRVAGIDEIEKELVRVAGEMAGITLTEKALASIEKRCAEVQRLEAQLQADSARVEFTSPAARDITVDGQVHTLAAGECWTQPASAAVTVDVPGVLSVRIHPGESAVKLRADLLAAQRLLDEELAAAGVADVAAASEVNARRRVLVDCNATQSAKLEGLCAGDDPVVLRTQLAELRAALSDGEEIDAQAAGAELTAAAEALRIAKEEAGERQMAASAAAAALVAVATEATVVRARLKTADAEFVTVREQLAMLRAALSDEAVAAQATADAEAHRFAGEAVQALEERYAAAEPATVDAELAAASQAVEGITAQRDETRLELHTLTAELAQLLRDTMIRHRDNTRQRYVQPYRAELERLGREVFGDSFEVDVNTELTIQTRTLDGCTVPFDSLSGGAREQLGILARLAGAALVAKEDTVPVIIDDALGFSDPDRLDKMSAVFNTVGGRGQVIVLTCTPGRYDGVQDAEFIELSA